MTPPELETPRLVLRGHLASDHAVLAEMWADTDVVRFIGGQVRGAQDVWFALLRGRGLWPVKGFGYWVVTDKASGEILGEAGFADFRRPLTPAAPDWPEAGWAFRKAAWGRGIASESVAAIHAWLDAAQGGPSFCVIDANNAASKTVAKRTGYTYWQEARLGDAPLGLYRRGG